MDRYADSPLITRDRGTDRLRNDSWGSSSIEGSADFRGGRVSAIRDPPNVHGWRNDPLDRRLASKMLMESNISKFTNELKKLIEEGDSLRLSLALDLQVTDEATKKKLREMKLPDFKEKYESWYSLAMQVVKQVLPDRIEDFRKQYKDEKRKQTDFLTYGVSDYMIGVQVNRGVETIVDGKAAFPKFEQQLNILRSAQHRLESSLFNMIEVLQADLFDNQLESATELCRKGFTRGAGAVAGVVLEKHLGHICERHCLKPRKKAPSINDLNQMLKDADVIDTPTWRFIQHLGDIRNICDHSKDREPSKENVNDLIAGVSKISKTLF